MNPDPVLQVTRRDVSFVRRTLHHLTATQKITCALVTIVTALLWWSAAKRILAFGRDIDYSGLHALGAQTVSLLQQYNPFFWWAVVALGTLLIIYILYGFVVSSQQRARRKLLSQNTVEQLANQLSESGIEVLNWTWRDRRNPLTVGDLQQTLAEMRSDRAGKITLARKHEALLNVAQHSQPSNKSVANNAEV